MNLLKNTLKILIGFCLGIIFSSLVLHPKKNNTVFSFVDVHRNSVSEVLDLIKKNYIDKIDFSDLELKTNEFIIKQLDPHSTYLTAEQLKLQEERMKGSFSGIGVQFVILRDTIFVVHAVKDGPSEKLGIRSGDKIIKINDSLVVGKTLNSNLVISKLRGEKNSYVNVKIKRKKIKDLLSFNIKRDDIPVFSIDATYNLTDKTGYIKIDRFSATTYNEFLLSSGKLIDNGIENFIIDLRGNGGGYLDAVIEILNEILPNGKMIVYTDGRKTKKKEYFADGNGLLKNYKIVVLVDESSASASEILAGAVQDNERGLVIGRRTFGKGLVQNTFNLSDGSMLILTVSKYYTPSGRNIQKPYKLGSEDNYNEELISRFKHGEYFYSDSIHFPDSLKFKTILGRTVYGGGGIMPDYFIPLDTSETTEFLGHLHYQGIFNIFSLDYVHNNLENLKKYKTIKEFVENFKINDNLYNSFLKFAFDSEIKKNTDEIKRSERLIKKILKARIASNLFDDSAYYIVLLENDIFIKVAIEKLEKKL